MPGVIADGRSSSAWMCVISSSHIGRAGRRLFPRHWLESLGGQAADPALHLGRKASPRCSYQPAAEQSGQLFARCASGRPGGGLQRPSRRPCAAMPVRPKGRMPSIPGMPMTTFLRLRRNREGVWARSCDRYGGSCGRRGIGFTVGGRCTFAGGTSGRRSRGWWSTSKYSCRGPRLPPAPRRRTSGSDVQPAIKPGLAAAGASPTPHAHAQQLAGWRALAAMIRRERPGTVPRNDAFPASPASLGLC